MPDNVTRLDKMFEIWDIFIGHSEFLVIEVAQKWQQFGLLFAFSFNIFFTFYPK